MPIKKYESKCSKESVKLINAYNRCLNYHDALKTEPLFISDMLSTVYLCNNIFLEYKLENVTVIKKMIADIDNDLISLHFKCREGSKDVNKYKKDIKSKVRKLKSLLLGNVNEKQIS